MLRRMSTSVVTALEVADEDFLIASLIERMFCRLKDWRRIATRYDKLARNFEAAVNIAAFMTWWAN